MITAGFRRLGVFLFPLAMAISTDGRTLENTHRPVEQVAHNAFE